MNQKILRTEYGEKFILKVIFNKFICFIAMLPMLNIIRTFLYSLTGMKIGKNVFIASYVLIDDQYPEFITIEDNVTISYRCTIIAHDDSKGIISNIVIKRDVWVGACATILPGVIIGEGGIVGANTTVTKDVPPKTTVVGARERIIKTEGK